MPTERPAGKDVTRFGPFAVKMHRPLLWMLSLRTTKNMWVVRAQASRRWRDFLLGVQVYRDDDDELCVDVGLWPLRFTLHQCELWPAASAALLAWADMEDA